LGLLDAEEMIGLLVELPVPDPSPSFRPFLLGAIIRDGLVLIDCASQK
jgi:hypothetical protein